MATDFGSPVDLRRERLWRGSLGLGLVTLLLLGGFLAFATPAAAAVTPGATTPLVNAGQLVRDGSTAVPIFGITAASTSAADQLLTVTVNFAGTGFNAGNTGDLLTLNANPARSGVALYEDVGSVAGSFDAGDVGVTATAAVWNGNQVVVSYAEPFPTVPVGAFDWILVIRTSNNAGTLADNDQIVATIPAGGIVFSGPVTQPAASVMANALTVSLTSVTDLISPQAWIGPFVDAVNAKAVLGMRIVDGGIATNVGINDMLSEIIVQILDVSGTYAGNSLLAPNVNPAQSGIGLYRDSNGNGVWDPADTSVMLSSISRNCVGPINVEDWCLFPNAEPVPNTPSTGYAYLVVVRTNAMGSGDDFRFSIQRNQIFASGVHADDANRPTLLAAATSSNLLGDDTPPCVTGGCGQPFGIHWANPTTSPYLFPADRTLYFSHGMGATPVPGEAVLSASDGESGLGQAVFSSEPSLAGSPSPVALSGAGVDVTIVANYSFNVTSTAASSPASVTVYDAVGNHATAPSLSYVLDTSNPLVVPAPGWTNLPGPNFYVNDTGTLWFSPWIPGAQTVDVRVDLSDTISGLKTATATSEPSLAGGPFYQDPTSLGGAGAFNGWTVSYAFNGASTDASSPATITACDEVANCASASFPYALDATPPSVSILAPGMGSVLSGRVIVAATASDAQSGVAGPLQVEILGQTGFMDMVWNGTAWVLPLSTGLYPDGSYRIVVRALDNVGNEGVAVVDVTFQNIVKDVTPPSLNVLSPTPYAVLSGSVGIVVASTDLVGFGTTGGVWIQLGAYAPIALTSGVSGWTGALNTTGVPDGTYTLSIWSTDAAGNTVRTSFPVTVDNTPPALAFVAPGSNALVSGIVNLQVSALDAVGVANVSLTFGSTTVSMASVGNGVYAYPLDTTALSSGSVALTVTARDFAGHATTRTLTVQVDNSAPAIVLGNPSSDRGAITLHATISDSPAGVTSVSFIVDGKTYAAVADGQGGYSVTIWTTAADNGAHSYEVVATDRAGNTATSAGTFGVNNPADYYAAFLAFAPLGIFLVLLAALVLALLLLLRRRKKPAEAAAMEEREPAPPAPKDEL